MNGLLDYGGRDNGGFGAIVLLHGLMGRGRTWNRQIPWLKRYGRVFTFDAAYHQGAFADDPMPTDEDIATERFATDVAELITWIDRGPAVLIGHSMGGLHAWCTASQYPELVSAIVVEDMAPDFRGRTTGDWAPWFNSWPDRFDNLEHAVDMFGEVAGRYFYESFDDGRLHGSIPVWGAIAEEWGTRDFWPQWDAVDVPALLLEAEFTVTPEGQMAQMAQRGKQTRYEQSQYLRVEGAGHLIHDDHPDVYRGAVEAFLSSLPG
ncbi:alpha/beta fold hydrolase [Gordonia sp. (in: high G+C Gram-positive bacteria)]|uniref:alpha/beta fold hydrolase n=1 Tax=Gordonia sp. (in: high G+C Gram-positive bacteria) TaxID=84139 RepID=UPI003C710BE1